MVNAANIVTIVFRAISSALSFGAIAWFIMYLKKRDELKNLFRRKFLIVTIIRGICGGISNIPGILMFTCISNTPDMKSVILNFFQSFFVVLTLDFHMLQLYIRSSDVLKREVLIIVKYLVITYICVSSSVILSAFALIFSSPDSRKFDQDRCTVQNPLEPPLGFATGSLVFFTDCILLYSFLKYLKDTKQLLGNSAMDVPRLISRESTKILIVSFMGLVGFPIYAFVPGDVGTIAFIFFEYAILLGLLLWLRMKYLLDNRESQSKRNFLSKDSASNGQTFNNSTDISAVQKSSKSSNGIGMENLVEDLRIEN